ncbi:MAG: YfhO family protein [archaeon]
MEEKTGLRKELMKTDGRFPSGEFALVWEDEQWRIWKYKKALPRTFFTPEYEVIPDKEAGIHRLFDQNFPYNTRLILAEDPFPGQSTVSARGTAAIVRYESSSIEINVDASNRGLVFLSDVYYPGWQATVDGKPVKIFIADAAFRAVPVPAGTHVVEMYYRPVSIQAGIFVTGISFTLAMFWIIRTGWRRLGKGWLLFGQGRRQR